MARLSPPPKQPKEVSVKVRSFRQTPATEGKTTVQAVVDTLERFKTWQTMWNQLLVSVIRPSTSILQQFEGLDDMVHQDLSKYDGIIAKLLIEPISRTTARIISSKCYPRTCARDCCPYLAICKDSENLLLWSRTLLEIRPMSLT